MPPTRTQIIVLDDLPCNGGTQLFRVPAWLDPASFAHRRQDAGHASNIVVPRSDPWVEQLAARQVLHTRLPTGEAWDWLVADVQDGVNNGAPTAIVIADPAEVILSDVGAILEVTPGGGTNYTFAYENRTPRQLLESFALPTLEHYGITYVGLGDIDSEVQLTGSFDMLTVRALIRMLEEATGHFFIYERDGEDGYLIHLRSVYAPLAPQGHIRQGANFLSLGRTRNREDLATVMVVRGAAVDGVRGPLGLAMWPVAATLEIPALDPVLDPAISMDDSFTRALLGPAWRSVGGNDDEPGNGWWIDPAFGGGGLLSSTGGDGPLITSDESYDELFLQVGRLQCENQAGGRASILIRAQPTTEPPGSITNLDAYEVRPIGTNAGRAFVRWVGGSSTTLGSETNSISGMLGTSHVVQVYTDPTGLIEAYMPEIGTTGEPYGFGMLDTVVSGPGAFGFYRGATADNFADDVLAFPSKFVRVSGLPEGEGWRARVLNSVGGVVAEGVEGEIMARDMMGARISTTTSGRYAMSWDVLDGTADVELRGMFVKDVSSSNHRVRLFARASGTGATSGAAGSQGYGVQVNEFSGLLELFRFWDGGFLVLDTAAFTVGIGQQAWVKLRVEGDGVSADNLFATAWLDGDDEPVGWLVTGQDTVHASGRAGIGCARLGYYCGYVSAALNGAASPGPEVDSPTYRETFRTKFGDSRPAGWSDLHAGGPWQILPHLEAAIRYRVGGTPGEAYIDCSELGGATEQVPRWSQDAALVGWDAVVVVDTDDEERGRLEGQPIRPGLRAEWAEAEWRVYPEDGLGGPGPIVEDHQFAGNDFASTHPKHLPQRYLEYPDGTRHPVLDSRAATADEDQYFVVSTPPAVGDEVRIAADSDGGLLTQVESPLGVSLYGKVVSHYDLDDIVAVANIGTNPLAESWPGTPLQGQRLTAREDHFAPHISGPPQSTTLRLEGVVPADATIPAGTMVAVGQNTAVFFTGQHPIYRTTADATAVAGEVDLPVSPELPSAGTTSIVLGAGSVLYTFTMSPPAGWEDVNEGTDVAGVYGRRPAAAAAFTAQNDGDQSAEDGNRLLQWTLKGMEPGTELWPGDYLHPAGEDERRYFVVLPAVVGEDGNVTLHLEGRSQSLSTFTATDLDMVVTRAGLHGPSTVGVVLMARAANEFSDGRTPTYLKLPPARVPYFADSPTVQVAAAVLVQRSINIPALALGGSTAVPEPPKLELWKDGAMVASHQPSNMMLDGSYSAEVTLSLEYTLADPLGEELEVRIAGAGFGFTNQYLIGLPITTVSGISITVGTGDLEDLPRGSPTRLHQDANLRLLERRLWASEYVVSAVELVERWGMTPEEAKLQLGQVVRLRVPEARTDVQLQVVDLLRPYGSYHRPTFILSTALPKLTDRLAKALTQGATGTVSVSSVSGGSGSGGDAYTRVETDALLAAKASLAHAAQHQHGGDDEIAVEVAAANAIPKANGEGVLDDSWLSQSAVEQHVRLDTLVFVARRSLVVTDEQDTDDMLDLVLSSDLVPISTEEP